MSRVILTSMLLMLAAACAPVRPSGSLLPPEVRIESPSVTPQQPTPELALPTATGTVQADDTQSDIAALAEKVYGQRLIEKIFIPALQVSSKVVPVGWRSANQPGTLFIDGEWDSPLDEVGWAISSALPDDDGNIILYGHNNLYTAIFRDLGNLSPGDNIYLFNALHTWQYTVQQVSILPVLNATAKERAAYLASLQPTLEARLTLISCWPPVSNTHRVVVLAHPSAYTP